MTVSGFLKRTASGSNPCHLNVTIGGFSVVLKGVADSTVGTHYRTGALHCFTLRGNWRHLEHDWIAKPCICIYEPVGKAHTLVITKDLPERMVAVLVVRGVLIYLDKAADGGFAAYKDGFTLLELTRKCCRQAGLNARQLDLMTR